MRSLFGFLRNDPGWLRKLLGGSGLMLAAMALLAAAYLAYGTVGTSPVERGLFLAAMLGPALVCGFVLWGYHVEFMKNVATGAAAPLPSWEKKWYYARRTARLFPFLILISIPGNAFTALYWWTADRWFLLTQQFVGILFYLVGPAFAMDSVHQAGGMKRPGLREVLAFAGRHFWGLILVQVTCPVILVLCIVAGALALGIGAAFGAFLGSLIWTYLIGGLVRKELLLWERNGGRPPRLGTWRSAAAMVAVASLFLATVVWPMVRWTHSRTQVAGVAVGDSLRYVSWKLGHESARTRDRDGSLWLEYPNRGVSVRTGASGSDSAAAAGAGVVVEIRAVAHNDPVLPGGLSWRCSEEAIRSRMGEPLQTAGNGGARTLTYAHARLLLENDRLVSMQLF